MGLGRRLGRSDGADPSGACPFSIENPFPSPNSVPIQNGRRRLSAAARAGVAAARVTTQKVGRRQCVGEWSRYVSGRGKGLLKQKADAARAAIPGGYQGNLFQERPLGVHSSLAHGSENWRQKRIVVC